MVWGSISLFGGFLENENSLETFIVIFESVSPKGSFWLKMKYFEISVSKRRILDIYRQPITATSSFQDVDVIPEKYWLNKAAVSSATRQCALHIFTSSDTDAPLLAPEHRFV